MNFKTIAEAFNFYMSKTVEEIESRAAAIGEEINTNANANIDSLNIELEGLKQAKENIVEKRSGVHGTFNPITGINVQPEKKIDDTKIFDSVEYRNAFYKTMLGQKLTTEENTIYNRAMELQGIEHRADAFNTTTNAAAVLPTSTLNEVIKKAHTMGGLMAECRGFNVPSNLAIPVGTPGTKAQWHTEGTPFDSQDATTVTVSFKGYEILKIMSMSVANKKMSIAAFESYIIDELTNCVMETISDSLINGTGVDQGTGLLQGVVWDNTNSLTYTTAPSYTDVINMLKLLKRGYSTNAKFAMNNSTLYDFYNILDGNGKPLLVNDLQNGSITRLLNKQVIIDDNIADGVVLLGDFKNYMAYNMPGGIMIETSRESSFKSGLVDYRALAIADTKPLVNEAFIKLYKSA